ncbi:MAG: HDOD domain-containing protein [Bryobacterales bacterium]|nr:HDOD domain-containing protein [Bryobacterales bacterium]
MSSLRAMIEPPKAPARVPLPPFPAVARKLLGAIAQDDCSMRTISDLVGSDAAFTVEVLRLANSAMFGLRHEVISVLHAVSVLGTHRLRGLVLTVGLRDFLRSARHDELVRRCWRHNLATALVCEWMGQSYQQDKAAAYTAGLLHDVGRLALLTMYPGRYLHILQLHRKTGRPIVQCEREALGQDHRELSAQLAREWRLPVSLTKSTCVQESDEPETGGRDMSDLITASCAAAVEMGFSLTETNNEPHLEMLQSRVPGSVWEEIKDQLVDLKESTVQKISIFESDFLAA